MGVTVAVCYGVCHYCYSITYLLAKIGSQLGAYSRKQLCPGWFAPGPRSMQCRVAQRAPQTNSSCNLLLLGASNASRTCMASPVTLLACNHCSSLSPPTCPLPSWENELLLLGARNASRVHKASSATLLASTYWSPPPSPVIINCVSDVCSLDLSDSWLVDNRSYKQLSHMTHLKELVLPHPLPQPDPQGWEAFEDMVRDCRFCMYQSSRCYPSMPDVRSRDSLPACTTVHSTRVIICMHDQVSAFVGRCLSAIRSCHIC